MFTDPAKVAAAPPDKPPRPDQILASDYRQIETWANAKLAAGGPDSFVRIYETSETLVKIQKKAKEPNGTSLPPTALPPPTP